MMPFDLTQGSTAQFDVVFFDATNAVTVPSSATLTVTYTSLAGASTSATIALAVSGSVWTATWGSAVSALGAAGYSVTAPGQASPSTGALRIVLTGPQS